MGKGHITRKELLNWIENYSWMVTSIEEARTRFGGQISSSYNGAKTTAYGIEATLPKASGGTSDPVFIEVQRRMQFSSSRIKHYEYKVLEVQSRIIKVEVDREKEVLNRLHNGDSMRSIGKHMGLSSTTIFRLRNIILEKMLN